MCVCVCERERERETDRQTETETESWADLAGVMQEKARNLRESLSSNTLTSYK